MRDAEDELIPCIGEEPAGTPHTAQAEFQYTKWKHVNLLVPNTGPAASRAKTKLVMVRISYGQFSHAQNIEG